MFVFEKKTLHFPRVKARISSFERGSVHLISVTYLAAIIFIKSPKSMFILKPISSKKIARKLKFRQKQSNDFKALLEVIYVFEIPLKNYKTVRFCRHSI